MEITALMRMAAADEKQPFKEKYDAREKLSKLLVDMEDLGAKNWKDSQVMNAARALINYKLGHNFWDCEENSAGEIQMQESLRLWKTVSPAMQLSFALIIQDCHNMIGVIHGNRMDSSSSLPHLNASLGTYNSMVAKCNNPVDLDFTCVPYSAETGSTTSFLLDFDKTFLEEAQKTNKGPWNEDKSLTGFTCDLNSEALETNLTQCIYYFAQYYAREEGM